jgi:hypothetical protein
MGDIHLIRYSETVISVKPAKVGAEDFIPLVTVKSSAKIVKARTGVQSVNDLIQMGIGQLRKVISVIDAKIECFYAPSEWGYNI